MTFVHLVRHGSHDLLGKVLCGRVSAVALNGAGEAEAAAAAQWFRARDIGALRCSPQSRTRQTAEAISAATGQAAQVDPALDEVDLGDWSGRTFDALGADPHWHRWNDDRAGTRPPGGETMGEAQARIVAYLAAIAPDRAPVVLVTHSDVIRCAVLAILCMPLQACHRFDVDPGSVTTLSLWTGGGKVVALNERPPPAAA